jgi:hypothetical protein
MNVKSIVARALRLPNGAVRFTGAAWSDGTPLRHVQIRVDENEWREATLEPKPSGARFTWTFWHYDWIDPQPGEHTVVSRAMDEDGRVQPSAEDPEIKLKQTYWESTQQWPWQFKL